jgi:hypothetical protein
LALKPEEFGRLLPGEFFDLCEGWEWRERDDWHKRAWLAATIINGVGMRKEPVSIDDLLGDPKKQEEKTGDQLRADLETLKRRSHGKRTNSLRSRLSVAR